MYLFSKVPNQPYIATQHFKDLQTLDEHWEMIRDEARALYQQGGIKAASSYNDTVLIRSLRLDGNVFT